MGTYETPSPAPGLRKLRIGDSWDYSVAGTFIPPDGALLALTGEISVSILPEHGSDHKVSRIIQFLQKFRVTQPDCSHRAMPAPVWMFFFVQDAAEARQSVRHTSRTIWDLVARGESPRWRRCFIPGVGRVRRPTTTGSISTMATL